MNFQQILKNYEEEIKGKNRKEIINEYESLLSQNAEELSKNEHFFKFSLNNIFSIISKINFNDIDGNYKPIEISQNIIRNILKNHFDEKETILILQNLNAKTISLFSYEEIFSLLELITNCPILVNLCNLYKEQNKSVDIDYFYELQQKDKEIDQLKKEINENMMKMIEPDIFKACKRGKLESVKWLIEKKKVDPNIRIIEKTYSSPFMFKGDSPIHVASSFGHLPIVQYLIEQQKVDVNIRGGYEGRTPLHYACLNGHLNVVEYLISKGADIEAKTDDYQYTPIFDSFSYMPVLEYIISKGANIEATDKNKWTVLHLVAFNDKSAVVEYLLSKGSNKYAKDIHGRTPYDVTHNYSKDIKNILR